MTDHAKKQPLKREFDTATQGQHFCKECGKAVELPHTCVNGDEWVKVPKQGGM